MCACTAQLWPADTRIILKFTRESIFFSPISVRRRVVWTRPYPYMYICAKVLCRQWWPDIGGDERVIIWDRAHTEDVYIPRSCGCVGMGCVWVWGCLCVRVCVMSSAYTHNIIIHIYATWAARYSPRHAVIIWDSGGLSLRRDGRLSLRHGHRHRRHHHHHHRAKGLARIL